MSWVIFVTRGSTETRDRWSIGPISSVPRIGWRWLSKRPPILPLSPPPCARRSASVDSDQPLYDVRPMTAVVERTLHGQWLNTVLVGAFAVMALMLASAGLYGVVSYLTAQRQREFGIRVAVGAKATDVLASGLEAGTRPRGRWIGSRARAFRGSDSCACRHAPWGERMGRDNLRFGVGSVDLRGIGSQLPSCLACIATRSNGCLKNRSERCKCRFCLRKQPEDLTAGLLIALAGQGSATHLSHRRVR